MEQGESKERFIEGTRREVVELGECKERGVVGSRRDVLVRGKQEVGEFSLKKDSAVKQLLGVLSLKW